MSEHIKEAVEKLIDYWEEETINLSHTGVNHPIFTVIKILAEREDYIDIVITTILERMKKEFTFFVAVLYHILPDKDLPVIPEDAKGKVKKLQKIWVKWGKDKGYLNE